MATLNRAAADIAIQAFLYGAPTILMDITKDRFLREGREINSYTNMSRFLTYRDTNVVRPNCDTFYSTVFFDLTECPLVMNIPPTGDQYYLMPLLDAFTNVIDGSPGTRTTQPNGGQYLLCGAAGLPSGVDTNIYTPILCGTDMVWAIGRFQVNDESLLNEQVDGGGYVRNLQEQLSITKYGSDSSPAYGLSGSNYPNIPEILTPNQVIEFLPIEDFFNRLNTLLVTNPPPPADADALALFSTIGVGPGLTFSMDKFDEETRLAMRTVPVYCVDNILKKGNTDTTSTHWTINLSDKMGNYGTEYRYRAIIAYNGLGANLRADALYYSTASDKHNIALNGKNKYTLTFDPVPPADAFWSLTMYNTAGYFIKNSIGRYGLGHDSKCELVVQDGKAVIYIQNEEIDSTDPRYPNWLPAPSPDQDNGDFNVMIRIYYPKDTAKAGVWLPPAIENVD